MKSKRLKKIFKVLGKILGVILIILLLLLIALRIPAVQTRIAATITSELQKKLNSTITIDKVAANFIDNFCIQGVFIGDQQNDTLLYAEEIIVDIGFWKLLSNEISVDDVSINTVVARVKQSQDSIYNFDFIIDEFASADTLNEAKETAPIVLNLNTISLTNFDLSADILLGEVKAKFDNTFVNFRAIDLETVSMEFDEIVIDKMQGEFIQHISSETLPDQVEVIDDEIYVEFPLNDLPFSLVIDKMNVNESSLLFMEKGFQPVDSFDARYIFAEKIHTAVRDVSVNKDQLTAEISDFNVRLNDVFSLEQLSADVLWDRGNLQLDNAIVATPLSTIKLSAKSNHKTFNNLVNFNKDVEYELKMNELAFAIRELEYFMPSLLKQEMLSSVVNSTLRGSGIITGNPRRTRLKKVQARINNSYANVDGIVNNFMDKETIGATGLTVQANAMYEDYKAFITDKAFAQKLSKLGEISLDSRFTGNVQDMMIDKLLLKTESLLEVNVDGHIRKLLDMEQLNYSLDIRRILTGRQDAAIFLDTLPDIVEKFDSLYYRGQLSGTKYKFDLDGGFETSLGDVGTNINIAFNKSYDDVQYDGQIVVDEFDLRELLDNDSLNTISLTAEITGEGMTIEDLDANIDLIVEHVNFNSYDYENIVVEGKVDGLKFNGEAAIDDNNIRLDFIGLVDMNDSIPIMDFDLAVDTLNLHALNLYGEVLSLEFQVESEITGLDVDQVEGDMVIRDLVLSNEELVYFTDSVTFQATTNAAQRGLYLDAPFLQANIEGRYELAKLPEIIINFLDQYFPAQQFLGESPEEDVILDAQEIAEVRDDYINAEIYIQDVQEIVNFFGIPITRMDSSRILFELDAPNNLTDFEMYIPTVIYNDIFIDSIYAYANNTAPEKVKGEFRIDSIALSETMHIAEVASEFTFQDSKAKVSLLVKSDADHNSLGLETIISTNNNQEYLIDLNEPFYLNDKKWTVKQDSSVIATPKSYSIAEILLKSQDETLRFAGETGGLNVGFTNFGLQNFTEIIGMDSLSVKGLMNGEVTIGLQDQIPVEGDLVINDVQFNDLEIGDFDLSAIKNGDEIVTKLKVTGESLETFAIFDFDLASQEVNGSANLTKLDLQMINPFVVEYANEVQGILNGKFDVTGSINTPDIDGFIDFTSVQAFIKPLETTYRIKDGTFKLVEDIIDVDIVMQDEVERLSYLTGEITHTYFTNLEWALNFKAEQFTFLDSKKSKRANFYGKFVAKVNADITGDPDLPIIKATIVALEETDMTVQLITGASAVSQENYIIFYDGSVVDSEEALDSIAELSYDLGQRMDISLAISTVEEALFHVVVDPMTGDKLDVQGTGNMVVNMTDGGELNISGDYTVSAGNYRLSYENTIKRDFALDAGSKIIFQGDPLNAQLDMRALYKTKTDVTALLEEGGGTIDDNASRRMDVNIVLNIGGTISQPDLSFDIRVPQEDTSPIGNAITSSLSQIRQQEGQLLTQVFSLILFNTFTGSGSGGNLTSVGASTAVSSIGNLINQQLNKLATKANGFEIDFQVDQYKQSTENANNVTEFNLGVKQKLFNDRVEISVGGNANLETGNQSTNNFSSFAGDFVIRYYLTRSGKYLVKVFQKSDYDALTSDSVWKTGVGLSYKTVFGREKVNRF